jgi:hypothetical protein
VTSKWAERARSSPYYPALSHPVFRKVLPGTAASALGDGMSAVALRRWLVGRHGAGLVIVNSVLRAGALGLVGGLALAGLLDLPVYVALLGVSSLLSAWGVAGKYTLIADLLPAGQRVAGNSVFGLADQVSLMIGPALAGVVTALAGAALVIVLDAASWLVLAVSYARMARSSGDRGCRCPWACSRTPARPARWLRSSRPAARCSSWPRRSASLSAPPWSPPSAPAAPCSSPPCPPSPSAWSPSPSY